MEDLNAWVTIAASWIAVIKFAVWFLAKSLPKVRKSLKNWRRHKRKKR